MDIRIVQAEQAEFDQKHWHHDPSVETVCHSGLHITKLAGKLATIAEVIDHGGSPDFSVLDDEVIPDLLIFAARLANNRQIDLSAAFNKRTAELEERFAEPVDI